MESANKMAWNPLVVLILIVLLFAALLVLLYTSIHTFAISFIMQPYTPL